jgi:hypothetical protein
MYMTICEKKKVFFESENFPAGPGEATENQFAFASGGYRDTRCLGAKAQSAGPARPVF